MSEIYLIDASPYIFRAYYSIPTTMESPGGNAVNAVYGFTDFLIQILKKKRPQYVAITFDSSLTTSFRNDIYPEYKSQRELPPAALEIQMQLCLEMAEALGMRTFIDAHFESDDLIGSILARIRHESHSFYIVSSDKDFAQLVDEKTILWDFARDQSYDSEKVRKKFGVMPERIVDLFALMGDSVDNIPGVKGIGAKTAVKLLTQFDNLEDIYSRLESFNGDGIRGWHSVKAKLKSAKDLAETSKVLARISVDAPVEIGVQDLLYQGVYESEVVRLFKKHGFQRIRERIPQWAFRK